MNGNDEKRLVHNLNRIATALEAINTNLVQIGQNMKEDPNLGHTSGWLPQIKKEDADDAPSTGE